jgi:phosphoribosylanthranilate isomerase
MFIKICGITRMEDALQAIESGATALGFVFWPGSPRAIEPVRAAAIVAALPPDVTTVGVFVNEPVDGVRRAVATSGVSAVQLHGDEDPSYAAALDLPIYRSVTLDGGLAAAEAWPAPTVLLLDAADPVRRGGTGVRVDWARAAEVARRRPTVLAGGLTPDNVEEAVRAVRPHGVDVFSGVERAPGIKDAARVAGFVTRARDAFARA